MELVVTDDGSTDETSRLVYDFAATVDFPVHFTTHPHSGFQLARCRNEGVAASTAPYLLFLDGDCLLPRHHVAVQLQRRRRGVVMAGDCVYLDEMTSAQVTEKAIRSLSLRFPVPAGERGRLARRVIDSWWYGLTRHPTKPKFAGGNVAIWRSDYERVNGYDENFVGWGGEDDDLRIRLRRAGVKIQSIVQWTHTYHLWHHFVPSRPKACRMGVNIGYLNRGARPVRCSNGLAKLSVEAVVG